MGAFFHSFFFKYSSDDVVLNLIGVHTNSPKRDAVVGVPGQLAETFECFISGEAVPTDVGEKNNLCAQLDRHTTNQRKHVIVGSSTTIPTPAKSRPIGDTRLRLARTALVLQTALQIYVAQSIGKVNYRSLRWWRCVFKAPPPSQKAITD